MRAVVVLAGGKGTRMRSDLPKLLHALLGSPLLEYPLELARAAGIELTAVVVGHGRDAIREALADRPVVWAVQEEQLGSGHAAEIGVRALLGALESQSVSSEALDVLVLNGDLPLLRPATVRDLLDRHERAGAEVTLLTCVKTDPFGFGRIVRGEGGAGGSPRLVAIVEEPDADAETRKIREVCVGTYVFRASTFLEFFRETDRDNRQGEYYLPDVVVAAARGGRRVETVRVEDESETAQVNSRCELAQASEILRRRLLEEYMDAGITIDDPRTTYIEKGVSIGRDARIHPFTVIRRGVTIGPGCEVGPFAQLRPGTVLEKDVRVGNFVEIKNSSIGEGTMANHLAYVGDGKIGRDVNVGAGTIFANFDGKRKHQTVVGDRAFIGSGTVLVAPLTVGEEGVTGAGSVVLRNRDVGKGEVVVGVPARRLEKKKRRGSEARE